ncbi:ParB family chromosome partitioning protein [Lachnospiraceae bacterium PF1-21]
MKKTSADKVELSSFDNLFGQEQSMIDDIVEISLTEIHSFKGHPFRVEEDEEMTKLVDSIKEEGVISPGIVRIRSLGGYEMVSGHRRCLASRLAGLSTMPCRCKMLTDEEAVRIMLDSNIQRENLLPSEKAFAYRMRLEIFKHQGKEGIKSAKKVGEEAGDNERKVYRLIRLTYLQTELLEFVDRKKIPVIAGAEISYLSVKEQRFLLEIINETKSFPNTKTSKLLKEASLRGKVTKERIQEILLEKEKRVSGNITIDRKHIQRFFPSTYSNDEMEIVIYSLLEKWQEGGEKGEGKNQV